MHQNADTEKLFQRVDRSSKALYPQQDPQINTDLMFGK